MCQKCGDSSHKIEIPLKDRRNFLKAGAAVAAATAIGGLNFNAAAASKTERADNGPYTAKAYGTDSASEPLKPMTVPRRALKDDDILIDIMYCGICHSDIHIARSEWGPSKYPSVPGHEIIGRVMAVGKNVKKFKIDDIAGVGCIVDSCGVCDNCVNDLEQYCLNGWTLVFNAEDKISGGITYGGFSDKIAVKEHYAIRIPPAADLPAIAPLLCAGITTFSPMNHWKLESGQRVAVIGLGGLGHLAVKLAAARKTDVTVFTTSPSKIADAKRLGAGDAFLWSDSQAMKNLDKQFDLMISTVPYGYPVNQFINLLKLDGTLVNVGALDELQNVVGYPLINTRRSLAGSVIGGIAETQEVVDYCVARNIKADIELIDVKDINRAFDRVVNKDVRYRFVIDMRSLKKA